ncbi:TetR/AcrR family transcriptional regulator [Pseudonocardia sp. GCM10023141]|uniref:TetR/AcrR family transcriptional regulator n=1 Tax=Pseudonocardia sp. GCM10023141 TaxID=3252653 RepID=UPI00361141EE
MTAKAPRRGRPPSVAKGEAILEAATDVFLEEGFGGAGVDVIAAAAGVSKQTVYSRYADKEALFLAVVEAARTEGAGIDGFGLVGATDLRVALVELGERLLGIMLTPRVTAFRRLIIAEAGRRPWLRELWNVGGPDVTLAALTGQLAEVLDAPDPGRAARQYLALLGHEANMRSHYGVVELDPAQRREIADEAADMIVRAYGRGNGS